MMTVHEVSRHTGVSIRALQYYDRIGLLAPAERTGSGYRLYDERALERLQQILLFRELEFSLQEIGEILDSPGFDRRKALEQQLELLTLKRERIDRLIDLARDQLTGGTTMNFEAFDNKKIEEYAAQAKEAWGETPEYQAYQAAHGERTAAEEQETGAGLMAILAAFGGMCDRPAADPEAQVQVKTLQDYITAHYYPCPDRMLARLGRLYAAGGEFTENIDRAGGPGTAAYAAAAIAAFCGETLPDRES